LIKKEVPMRLPEPRTGGDVSLEKSIKGRRTARSFASRELTADQFSQLLWAAQGVTEENGSKRAAPSEGALYPLDIYAVIGNHGVTGRDPGIYHYEPRRHAISPIREGDRRVSLAKVSLSQMWMASAPIQMVITAEYGRICSKYGERGIRYAMIEAGHAGQNVFLQAEALGLCAGIVGAFDDREVIRQMDIPDHHEPLLIMPVGYPK
jgi:SagB-type dehydrogenase family enzyme